MAKAFSSSDAFSSRLETEGLNSSAGLLVSILVRYPEIASVKLAPRDGLIRLTFMLHGQVQEEELERFTEVLTANLEAFHGLLAQHNLYLAIENERHGDYLALYVHRDVGSLTREEISLIGQVVADTFGASLVKESGDPIPKEDEELHEDMIDALLDDLRTSSSERDLIGYREEGRVFVFDKSDGRAPHRA